MAATLLNCLPRVLVCLACALAASSRDQAWERDPTPLLTNFNNMYQPCVVEVGGEWRYRMWFFGWAAGFANPGLPGADAIFHARSRDLRHWDVYSADRTWDSTMNPKRWQSVLYASDRWYDNWHNGDPSVVWKDGSFVMAYSATGAPLAHDVAGYPNKMVLCIMGATSPDGIQWKKTERPLLIRAGDSADPSPEPERIGDFNRPCLRWDGDRWKLWFDYWIPGRGCCLGYAENVSGFAKPGGFKIKHDLSRPLMDNWVNPEVIKVDGTYHLFGDPTGYPVKSGLDQSAAAWMGRQLCEAVSPDGVSWKRLGFIPPDSDADACHVPQALITEIDDHKWLYLFYATQTGFKLGDGQYHYQYDRIRAMRRRL
ncbi:MAG: hypothetical protein ACHQ50_06995 [Fimbriimonadales bacterium]